MKPWYNLTIFLRNIADRICVELDSSNKMRIYLDCGFVAKVRINNKQINIRYVFYVRNYKSI